MTTIPTSQGEATVTDPYYGEFLPRISRKVPPLKTAIEIPSDNKRMCMAKCGLE
jgi:hypothetical protein